MNLRLLLVLVLTTISSIPLALAGETDEVIQDYISLALQGRLDWAGTVFEERERGRLSEAAEELRELYAARFLRRNEALMIEGGGPFLQDLVCVYQDYWTQVMMAELPESAGSLYLEKEIAQVLTRHARFDPLRDEDVLGRMGEEIESLGLHQISGVTRPYFDLLIWARMNSVRFTVQLTDELRPVEVNFMDQFLVKGWAHFATFGRAYTGGWATREGLYCLREDWDLDSEKFRVSYLGHETRHVADYELFPSLQQTDLEYRAKLTELALADETLYQLIDDFSYRAELNPEAPHAYANYAVVRELSQRLMQQDFVESDLLWLGLEKETINRAARQAIESHTIRLLAAGAETVQALVCKPTGSTSSSGGTRAN